MAAGRVKMLTLLLLAVLAHTGNGLQNVSLRVSSLKSTLEGHELDTLQHQLLMDWQPGLDADWIGLFNVSSLQQVTQDTQPLIRISPDDYPDGYYSINISFAELQYPNGWSKGTGEKPMPGDACLSYWIAAYKDNELLEADCLKIHPTWMWDHRSELENMPLIGLFFPGTYSGLNYNLGSTPLPRQTVSHFLLTQDSDVWGELIRGVRYLDVDLRYCPNQEKSSSTSETPKAGRQRRGTPAEDPAAAGGDVDGIQWTVSCIDGQQSVGEISGVPGLGGYLGGGAGRRRSAATGGGAGVRFPAARKSAVTPAAATAALPQARGGVSGGDDTQHRCSVNHGLSDKKNDLLFVLKDVKEFLKTAKYEIIILDFHHFPEGFEGQTNLHHEFVSLLYSELGDYILPFNNITYNSTLKEVWHAGHNIIVAYNDSETTKEFGWLWGPIPRLYGDHQTTEGLKTFLQQCMDDASATIGTTLEISMTRNGTTPAVSTQNTSDSLHGLADMDDRNITKWFHDYWWRHSNLVATDFFVGNHITDVNVRACLDKANNVIFQVISED